MYKHLRSGSFASNQLNCHSCRFSRYQITKSSNSSVDFCRFLSNNILIYFHWISWKFLVKWFIIHHSRKLVYATMEWIYILRLQCLSWLRITEVPKKVIFYYFSAFKTASLMLVTAVGDQMCWWQVWDVGDRFRMLVAYLIHWKNHQHNEKSHQHNDSATNIWNQSPS